MSKSTVLKRLASITHAPEDYLDDLVWAAIDEDDFLFNRLLEGIDSWLVAQEFYKDNPDSAKARRNDDFHPDDVAIRQTFIHEHGLR